MNEPLTITAAAPLIRSGELTPSELLEQCLARIDVYEPHVKAWVYFDRERARREAQQLTDEVKAGRYRGPLHGIPVGIKDIIDVFDMPTGCGSKLWATSYARRDATCVRDLRHAGALILGKVVTTPYAFTDPPLTRNPWNLERTPGGSSSGSAAAVACGMCLAALATQTGGSTTRPASFCGVCSLKATYGSVRVEGVLPLAPSLDHVGIMANCVRDLALVFEVVNRPLDPVHTLNHSYSLLLDENSDWSITHLHQPGVAQVRGLFEDHAEAPMRELMAQLRRELPNAEPTVDCEMASLPPMLHDVIERHYALMATEAALVHGERLNRRPEDYPPNITKLVRDAEQFTGRDLAEVYRHQTELKWAMSEQLRGHALLLTPATCGPAPTLETTGSHIMNSPWSYTGLPTVSLPAGWSDGLPLGIQLAAEMSGEARLFLMAAQREQQFLASGRFVRRLPPVT